MNWLEARNIAAQVCRVWSVSGPHVQHPSNYALSDFILQAQDTGRVLVSSPSRVIRSYASVDDVLALALASLSGGSGQFDTGGAVIEVGDLAHEVAHQSVKSQFSARTTTHRRHLTTIEQTAPTGSGSARSIPLPQRTWPSRLGRRSQGRRPGRGEGIRRGPAQQYAVPLSGGRSVEHVVRRGAVRTHVVVAGRDTWHTPGSCWHVR